MSEIDVRIKGGATGRVRAGATVGEVLERLDAGVAITRGGTAEKGVPSRGPLSRLCSTPPGST